MVTRFTVPVSQQLVEDLKLGTLQIVIWMGFSLLLSDGGDVFRWSGAAVVGYLLGVFAIALKRTGYIERTDTFVRWGFLPSMVIGLALEPTIHHYIRR